MTDYQKVVYEVICNKLYIRTQPTVESDKLDLYYIKGEIIRTGSEPFVGYDGRHWVKYLGAKSNTFRYVCYQDQNEIYLKRISPPKEEEPKFPNSLSSDIEQEDLTPFEYSDNNNEIPVQNNFDFGNTNSNDNKKNLFNSYQVPQKHDKFSNDNLLKRIKTLSLNIIKNEINLEINSMDLYELRGKELQQISQEGKINKLFYINLLNTTFREIFSSNKYKNKKDYNKELIDKIYEIYERDKSCKDEIGKKLNDIVDFFNKTYLDFWKGLTNVLNSNNMSIEEANENNKFFNLLLEKFNKQVVDDLKGKNESDDYIQKIQFMIKDFPSKIYNMKDIKK